MACPYTDCPEMSIPLNGSHCPACRRPIKTCGKCSALSPAFANFCRQCCHPFLRGHLEGWTGFRGGPTRRGLNETELGLRLKEARILPVENGQSLLSEPCAALLSWDGHLVAVAASGRIGVFAPQTAFAKRLQTPGPLTCHPCIDRATLFLGRQGALTAVSLAGLFLREPKDEARWSHEVPGRPIEALLALEDQLFFVLERSDGLQEVAVLGEISSKQPSRPSTLFVAEKISTLAGNPIDGRICFVSEEGGQISLHSMEAREAPLHIESHLIRDLASTHLSRPIIATMGKHVYGTFGDRERLCRLAPGKAAVQLDEDVQRFALNGFDHRVQVESTGLSFPPLPHKEDLTSLGQVIGEPIILRNCAAAIGLQDGRVILFDLALPNFHREIRVDATGYGVTTLASFGPYLAAASSRGTVALYEIKAS